MKSEIIYGKKTNPTSYIEFTLNDNGRLDICINWVKQKSVWHLIMKDPTKYEAFKKEMIEDIEKYPDELWWVNDFVQAEDIHEKYGLSFDIPATDTDIYVSIEAIDEYIEEVSARLTYYIEGKCDAKRMFRYRIDPKKPLGGFSFDYWNGVMATLNWLTTGGEKHDSEPQ